MLRAAQAPDLGVIELSVTCKASLKGFCSVLKGADEHLRFVFLTGVTKFSKVSVFSGLNQLLDISLSANYAGVSVDTRTKEGPGQVARGLPSLSLYEVRSDRFSD